MRWEDIWLPERIIFQFPEIMAEKGMPLDGHRSAIVGNSFRALHTPYHVEVTCVPAGSVLMAEQAYWLLSGPTNTGVMVSCEHPTES